MNDNEKSSDVKLDHWFAMLKCSAKKIIQALGCDDSIVKSMKLILELNLTSFNIYSSNYRDKFTKEKGGFKYKCARKNMTLKQYILSGATTSELIKLYSRATSISYRAKLYGVDHVLKENDTKASLKINLNEQQKDIFKDLLNNIEGN